jgi:hypothetical protein
MGCQSAARTVRRSDEHQIGWQFFSRNESFFAERDQRIDARGASRGDVAGQKSDRGE